MSELDRLLSAADASRDEAVQLLRDLVRTPTVNAGPRPDTGNETAACDLLRAKLQPEEITFEVHESAPQRGNLIARIGNAGGKRLLLMSHTDVVPVEDESLWEHPPFPEPSTKVESMGAAPTTIRPTSPRIAWRWCS